MRAFVIIFILSCSMCFEASGQGRRSRNSGFAGSRPKAPTAQNDFLKQQWRIGLRLGTNLTGVSVQNSFSSFSAIDYEDSRSAKVNNNYSELGIQAGLDFIYSFKQISIALQPNYRRLRFTYTNDYAWQGENGGNALTLSYIQDHSLDYLDFPISLCYEFYQGNWKPYVHFGIYYGLLINAIKEVEVEGSEQNQGGLNTFEQESFSLGADDLFITSSWGLTGGLGVNYDIGNIRLNIEAAYRYGLNNITDAENRFSDNRLAGIGDALDDIQLRNIELSFGVLFPLRFLGKGFTAN